MLGDPFDPTTPAEAAAALRRACSFRSLVREAWRCSTSSHPTSSSLTSARFLMFRARLAYLIVERVSVKLNSLCKGDKSSSVSIHSKGSKNTRRRKIDSRWRNTGDHESVSVSTERVLEKTSQLRVSVRDVGCEEVRGEGRSQSRSEECLDEEELTALTSLHWISESRDDVSESEKTRVDRDSFLESFSEGGSSFELKGRRKNEPEVRFSRTRRVEKSRRTRSLPARSDEPITD